MKHLSQFGFDMNWNFWSIAEWKQRDFLKPLFRARAFLIISAVFAVKKYPDFCTVLLCQKSCYLNLTLVTATLFGRSRIVLEFWGGRRIEHILIMAQQSSDFEFVVVLVGNNEINCSEPAAILRNIRTFASAVGVEGSGVLEFFYRKGNRASVVNRLNQMQEKSFRTIIFD